MLNAADPTASQPRTLIMQRVASDETRARIPVLHRQGYSVKDICHLLAIKKTLVYKVLAWHSQLGVVSNPRTYSCTVGRPRVLTPADLAFISSVIDHRPSIYLDELRDELQLKRNVRTTLPTLTRAVEQLGVTRKAISARAAERNELSRALYMNRIAEEVPDPNMLVFIDEAAKDERTVLRGYGRSGKGLRCNVQRRFVRGTRYSIIPAITLDGIIAYDIVEGPVDTERFVKFLKEHVMPFTNPYPGPRSVLVMDNCHIHHGEEVRRLVEEDHLCKLIYLPAYSPDYNPIEQAFSSIKAYIRRHGHDAPLLSIARACQNITPDKAEEYFRASGYIV